MLQKVSWFFFAKWTQFSINAITSLQIPSLSQSLRHYSDWNHCNSGGKTDLQRNSVRTRLSMNTLVTISFASKVCNVFGRNGKSTTRFLSTTSRPFKVLGIQQIAIGCVDKGPLEELWKGVFGLEVSATKRIETENVEEDIVKLGKSPFEVEIDLMRPIDAEKSPKVHVPPLNHLGLWIDDLETAVNWMEGQGVRFTPGGIRKGAAGHNVTFIHPKGNDKAPIGGAGVLIELVQAPPEVIEAFKYNAP
jgi:lactoylglutathione lyase